MVNRWLHVSRTAPFLSQHNNRPVLELAYRVVSKQERRETETISDTASV